MDFLRVLTIIIATNIFFNGHAMQKSITVLAKYKKSCFLSKRHISFTPPCFEKEDQDYRKHEQLNQKIKTSVTQMFVNSHLANEAGIFNEAGLRFLKKIDDLDIAKKHGISDVQIDNNYKAILKVADKLKLAEKARLVSLYDQSSAELNSLYDAEWNCVMAMIDVIHSIRIGQKENVIQEFKESLKKHQAHRDQLKYIFLLKATLKK